MTRARAGLDGGERGPGGAVETGHREAENHASGIDPDDASLIRGRLLLLLVLMTLPTWHMHPYYLCSHEGSQTASPWCQSIPGGAVDRRVGELLVGLMTPLTLDVALQVQDELAARAEEADLWRAQRVQRAREEADLARQRFMQAHPDNRMVADVLEAEWNAKLRALDEAQHELERGRAEPGQGLEDGQRERILALASDFPRLWNDPATPHRERKRMARLLIEDVTITKATRSLGVRLRGGATRQLTWTPDPLGCEMHKTSEEVVAEIDRLLDDHTDGEVAKILNERGHRSGYGLAFTAKLVGVVRGRYALKSRYQRLRDRGLLRRDEIAGQLGVPARGSGPRAALSNTKCARFRSCGLRSIG